MPSPAQKKNPLGNIKRPIRRFKNDTVREKEDFIAIEEPLEVMASYDEGGNLKKETISITMRTPGDDEELASGFFYAEGLIGNRDDIVDIEVTNVLSNAVTVKLKDDRLLREQNWERRTLTNSSCGVCGKGSIDFVGERGVFIHRPGIPEFHSEKLFGLVDTLQNAQTNFDFTGGVHAALLFDMKGKVVAIREDVGRHNAMDKLIGWAVLNDHLPLKDYGVLLSGRSSFELMQKAHMAGISIVISVGAPSSLAIELAEETGQTLAGFIKGRKFNIYNDQGRLHFD